MRWIRAFVLLLTLACVPVSVLAQSNVGTITRLGSTLQIVGSVAALNGIAIQVDTSGYRWVSIQVGNTFVGTLAIETSNTGVDWETTTVAAIGALSPTPGVVSATAPGMWQGPVNARYFRVKATDYVSGTADVTTLLFPTPSAWQLGSASGDGGSCSPITGFQLTTAGNPVMGTTAFDQSLAPLCVVAGADALASAGGELSSVAIGDHTLTADSSGTLNTAVGFQAGTGVTTGGHNTILGAEVGQALTTGSGNIYLGNSTATNAGSGAESNTLRVGTLLVGDLSGTHLGIGASPSANAALDASSQTSALKLPSGTTAQRPTAENSMIRYNSDIPGVEVRVNGSWTTLGAAGGPTGTVNTGTAGQLAYYGGTGTAVDGNVNANISNGSLTLGVANTTIGKVLLKGNTSGTVTIAPQAAAGTPVVTWGTNTGTPVVTASSPLVVTSATGDATCPTCATTTNGGDISGSAPVAVDADGVISLSGSAGQVPNGATGAFTATPTLGVSGASLGSLTLAGNSSGSVLLRPQAAAGTPTITWGTNSGTPAVSVNAPMSLNTATGNLGISGVAGKILAGSIPNFQSNPTLGVDATTTGQLSLANGGALGTSVTLQNNAATTAYNFNLPAAVGSSGQVLTSAGGVAAPMTWTTLAGSATTDTTSATNITTGTLPSGRLTGSYTGVTGLGTVTAGTWTATKVGLPYGGTNADLSATGGTSQVLQQTSVGGTVTVGQLAASNLSNGTTGTAGTAVVLATSPTVTTPTVSGGLALAGSSSGTVTQVGQAAAGTPTITWGTNSGTPAVSVNAPISLNTATGNLGISGVAGKVLAGATPNFQSNPTLGVNASLTGQLLLANGGASGTSVTVQNPSSTTAYNFNLPATVGTSGQVLASAAGGSSPMTWTTLATSATTDTTSATNITSGTLPAARLPNPSASTLGGIQSYAAVSDQWINAISTSGVPSSTQPAASNLSNGVTGSGAVVLATSPTVTGISSDTHNATATGGTSQYQIAGANALWTDGATNQNTAVGLTSAPTALAASSGTGNTFMGYQAGNTNSTGSSNVGIGTLADATVTTGGDNVAVGNGTLHTVTTTNDNTAVGDGVLGLHTGANATGMGSAALQVATGAGNTAFGRKAGFVVTTGANNLLLGPNVASTTLTTGSNNIAIGVSSAITTAAAGTSNSFRLGGTGGALIDTTGTDTAATAITSVAGVWKMPNLTNTSAAQTGTVCWSSTGGTLTVDTTVACLSSSMRFKERVNPLGDDDGLRKVMALRPVSFFYKDRKFIPDRQVGLIAEDVVKVDKRLVAFDNDKKTPRGVRYQNLTALLIKAIQEQQAQIDELKRQLARRS